MKTYFEFFEETVFILQFPFASQKTCIGVRGLYDALRNEEAEKNQHVKSIRFLDGDLKTRCINKRDFLNRISNGLTYGTELFLYFEKHYFFKDAFKKWRW